jgi:hypothetical protein
MMKPYPELQTDRLILREFAVEDATSVNASPVSGR